MLLSRLFRLLGQHEQAQSQLGLQALHDPLTGLPNRRLLLERVAAALARPASAASACCSATSTSSKTVNDEFGHAAGDELLRQVAGRLGEVLAPGDTLARLGGDQFVVCSEGRRGLAEVQALGAALSAALAPPFLLGGREVTIAASIGVTVADGQVEPEQLLREADTAMYAAKQRGSGRVVAWDAAQGRPGDSELQLERELRVALRSGELRLHVQPIADLTGGRTAAVEALLLGAPPAGAAAAQRVRPAGGADHADRRPRRMGAARGLPAGARLAAAGGLGTEDVGQRVRPSARHTGLRGAGARRA